MLNDSSLWLSLPRPGNVIRTRTFWLSLVTMLRLRMKREGFIHLTNTTKTEPAGSPTSRAPTGVNSNNRGKTLRKQRESGRRDRLALRPRILRWPETRFLWGSLHNVPSERNAVKLWTLIKTGHKLNDKQKATFQANIRSHWLNYNVGVNTVPKELQQNVNVFMV